MRLLGRGRRASRGKHGSAETDGSPGSTATDTVEAPVEAPIEEPDEEVDGTAGAGEDVAADAHGDSLPVEEPSTDDQRDDEQPDHDPAAQDHDERDSGAQAHAQEAEAVPAKAHGPLGQEEQHGGEADGEPAEQPDVEPAEQPDGEPADKHGALEQEQSDERGSGTEQSRVEPAVGNGAEGGPPPARAPRTPLYSRLLRLKHVHPNGWQRALLAEGSLAVAGLLVLADLATAWTLLVLPVAVAAFVKANDLLAGFLARRSRPAPSGADATAPADSEPATDPDAPPAVADGPDAPAPVHVGPAHPGTSAEQDEGRTAAAGPAEGEPVAAGRLDPDPPAEPGPGLDLPRAAATEPPQRPPAEPETVDSPDLPDPRDALA